jgi:hypothetical protein
MGVENKSVVEEYKDTLENLLNDLYKLGLENDPPKESVIIIPGTQSAGRPLGARLPVYPESECGTDEEGMGKTLFNLKSLTGFTPPTK